MSIVSVAKYPGESSTLTGFIRDAVSLLPEYTWQRSADEAYAAVVAQLEEQLRVEVIVDNTLCAVLVLEDDVHVGRCLCIEAMYGHGNVCELFRAVQRVCCAQGIEIIVYAKRKAPGRYLTVYRRVANGKKGKALGEEVDRP